MEAQKSRHDPRVVGPGRGRLRGTNPGRNVPAFQGKVVVLEDHHLLDLKGDHMPFIVTCVEALVAL